MSKLFVFDCDGVLLNWHEGFINYVKQFGHELDPDSDYSDYDMSTWFKDMSLQEFKKLVVEFNSYPRVLRPLEMAKAAIMDLTHQGHKVKVLTAFGSCPIQTEFRQEYLNMLFNDNIDEVIVLGLGECKKEKLEELKPDVFVEDSVQHAETARDLGISTYLISTTYNQGVEGVTYVWDCYEVVILEENK